MAATRPIRQLLVTTAIVLGVLLVLGIALWWLLFKDTASTKRQVTPPPMLTLPPPPPPPPPPPEKPPEPETPEETVPDPEPLEQPTPAEEPTPAPEAADPVTMDAQGQAGTDSFGIQSGSGGGSSGVGRGGGTAGYGRYLGYVMQQAIARDPRLRRLAFQLQINVWLEADGRLSRVELLRGSGNDEADAAVLDVLRQLGRVDQPPPPSQEFPARVLVQGRRPGT
ncbi:energy transducer TonB [Stenotrophomonas sp. 24(2023)]|uniref:energy transducer TonB family protein n=1 Tax=Stenotrophomonas sp. 24(2023) TaxID=3068324 RepID=UPI0027E188F4|nr:energy transducer TonB [Stenotrophomonas sp. 24(2023)]WMJ69388.1 energy transducer TonB [Stenotrophomonas sp. 24(2023)]